MNSISTLAISLILSFKIMEPYLKMNKFTRHWKRTSQCNSIFTLRKCASKIIDSLSNIFPEEVYDNIKQHLDTGIQNQDWLVK